MTSKQGLGGDFESATPILSHENWCGVCQEKPVVITEIFSNIDQRNTKKKCKKCGNTLAVSNWRRDIQ
jgi:hypothetical protein